MLARGIDVLGGRPHMRLSGWGRFGPLHKTTRRTKAAKSLYTKHRNTKWLPYQYKSANDWASTNRFHPNNANTYANCCTKTMYNDQNNCKTLSYHWLSWLYGIKCSSLNYSPHVGELDEIYLMGTHVYNTFSALANVLVLFLFIGHNVWSEISVALLST